jgi:hypothetical protein
MKLSTLLSISTLALSATAWKVSFHTRSNIGWNVHGTKDVTCNTLNWPSGKTQEDVEYIKYDLSSPSSSAKCSQQGSFEAATDNWPDPNNLILYPGSHCGGGAVYVKPGVSKPGKGFLVGSYAIA